jgi:nucleotide-binding universal stress UspA family protein
MAVRAALWAVDEAIYPDLPIRMLYVIDAATGEHEDEAHRLATAEIEMRYVCTAIEAAAPPVQIDIEIVHDNPASALVHASAAASLVCVGAVGFRHFTEGHIGSTAETLAMRAHCPVAIIRDPDRPRSGERADIVTVVDDPAQDSAVLGLAVDEALRRRSPLRVVTVVPDSDEHAATGLDKCVSQLKHRNPDLEIHPEVLRGPLLDYLTEHAARTRLLVVGAPRGADRHHLFSPNGYDVLQNTRCTLLIADDGQ